MAFPVDSATLEQMVTRFSTDLLTVHECDGACLYASGEAVPLLGVRPDALVGRRLQDLVVPEDRANVDEELRHLSGHETRRLRYRVEALDGTKRWVETRVRKSDPFLIAATREVEEESHRGAEWAHLRIEARTDWLTQLLNRWGLEEALETELDRALRSGHVFAIAFFDVDRFKSINDTLGHGFGDHVLRRIAAVIGRGRRSYDVPGRWGGDEFLLILPETTLAEAVLVAERMVSEVAVELLAAPRGHSVTLSAGVAASTGVASVDALVECADRAMYRAKAMGGNRVYAFDPEEAVSRKGTASPSVARRRELTRDLR